MTDSQVNALVKAITSIAMGDKHPGGLERLAMAFDSEDANSVGSAINNLAHEVGRVADALQALGSGRRSE